MYRRVKDLREDNELTQEYLAQYLSCTQSAYSRIESGGRQLSIDYLIKLSILYNVSTDFLLGLTDYPQRVNRRKK
ncbi:helix-turn-helix transcriptional regulator [Streptococcus thermophilus]|uniref:helix-turn-helix domain-containing protein n=1 Tax=Streptococcus thermophilus TaxID=1308 RepID=UPI0019D2E5C0|nr:helix-turn-helix transcriptional regulator [Streptococcus thermophilus]MBN6047281.1 helix-turn-helix transcriptional regulator [Streptococcus thermophilus]